MSNKTYRSAKTGKFVSKKFADHNKETTVGETITKSKKKKMPKKAKEVEIVEEKVEGTSMWKAVADFIYYGGIVVLVAFAFGFMQLAGSYFAALALNLI